MGYITLNTTHHDHATARPHLVSHPIQRESQKPYIILGSKEFLQQQRSRSWTEKLALTTKIGQFTIWYAGSLGLWDKGIVNQVSDVPSIIFFMISFKILCKNPFNLFFYEIIKNKRKGWNDFCKEFFKKLWKKNNTWNIRRLVDESFVPANQQTSVLYWRLSDFK